MYDVERDGDAKRPNDGKRTEHSLKAPPPSLVYGANGEAANHQVLPPAVSNHGVSAGNGGRSEDRERYIRCQMKNGNKIKIKAETGGAGHGETKHLIRTSVDRVERMGLSKARRARDRHHRESRDSKEVKESKDLKDCKGDGDGEDEDEDTKDINVTMTGPDGATIIESANSSPSPCPETIACRGGGGIVKTNKAYIRLVSRRDEEGKMETLKWHGVSLAHCYVKRTDTVIKRDPASGEEYTATVVAQGHKCMTLNCKYPHLYSQKCHWKRHALTEHCNRKFSCKFCGATFRQQTQRKEHIVNKHTVQMTKWQCPYGCGGVFSQFRGVVRHVKLDRKCSARGEHFEDEEVEALKSGWNNILMKEMLKFETNQLSEENMVTESMKKEVRAKTKKLYGDQGTSSGNHSGKSSGKSSKSNGKRRSETTTTTTDEGGGRMEEDDAVE